MLTYAENTQTAKRYFWYFCLAHFLVWVIVPSVCRHILPRDTVEGIAWGLQWQWGYDKHPPLAAWLTAAFFKLTKDNDIGVYVLAQLAIITSFWAVWRLAQYYVKPLQALVAVMLLDRIYYYNLLSVKFNPGTLMTPIWALNSLCFYWAIKRGDVKTWLLFALVSALNMYTKYQAPLLFLPMLFVIVFTQTGRRAMLRPGPYWGLVVFFGLLLPHGLWAYQLGFPEWHYAFGRTAHYVASEKHWYQHMTRPLLFFMSELGAMVPAFLMLLPLTPKLSPARGEGSLTVPAFEYCFLTCLGLGPLLLTTAYAAITGDHLAPTWGTPYLSLMGLCLIVWLKPEITQQSFRGFIVIFSVFFILYPVARYSYLYANPHLTKQVKGHAYTPGKQLARAITQRWRQTMHTPLGYIAGDHYLMTYITAYSPDHPTPYFDWQQAQSPWIDEQTLRRNGAMFAWPLHKHQASQIPPKIQQRFTQAKALAPLCFAYNTTANVGDYCIGLALLPPQTASTIKH